MLKNITLSADEAMIARARRHAEAHNSTLNAEFRRWLAQYAEASQSAAEFADLMESLSYAKSGKTFTRDELNER